MAEVVNSIKLTTSAGKSGQWKLVAGLVTLLGALLSLGGNEDDESADVSETTEVTTESPGSEVAANNRSSPARPEILWPDVSLEFLLSHNPFRAEFSKPQSAVAVVELNASSNAYSNTSLTDANSPSGRPASSEQTGQPDSNPNVTTDQDMRRNHSAVNMKLPKMTVQVVVRGSRGRAAMIDNQIYHEGDRINGFEIASIAHDGVTLRRTHETDAQPKTME